MVDGKAGKVGPVSKKIIECVKANPGIHAAQVARVLGIKQGGGMRATVRALISSGYLSRGKAKVAADPQYHTATLLEYTGKPFMDSTRAESRDVHSRSKIESPLRSRRRSDLPNQLRGPGRQFELWWTQDEQQHEAIRIQAAHETDGARFVVS